MIGRRPLVALAPAVVVVLYVALTIGLAYPFSTHTATHVLALGTDTDLYIWTIGWDVHAFLTHPLAIFNANIFFPHANTLAYSENLIGTAFIAAPILWLTGNTLQALNIAMLATSTLCACGGYFLARTLGVSRRGAFVCGLVYGFTPPRFFRMEQAHVASTAWIPFLLAYLHRYVATDRARDLRIAAALFSLQAIASGHGASMSILAIGLLALWEWSRGVPLRFMQRMRDLGWQGALCLLPCVLIYIPYRAAGQHAGLTRTLDDWSINTVSFFSSPSFVDQYLLQHIARFWPAAGDMPGVWLFPGLVPLLLAAFAVVSLCLAVTLRRPHPVWRCLAVALNVLVVGMLAWACWVTAHGGVNTKIGGWRLRSNGATPWIQLGVLVLARLSLIRRAPLAPVQWLRRKVHLVKALFTARDSSGALWPYVIIYVCTIWMAIGPPFGLWGFVYWLPGLKFMREPSRFMVLGFLALGVVAAYGVDALTRRFSARGRLIASAAIVCAMIAEFSTVPVSIYAHDVEKDVPAIDRWIATQPEPMALLETPIPDSGNVLVRERRNTLYMLHSMAHWKPIFQGFSGLQPPGYVDAYWKLTGFPDEPSLATIKQLGITHVILHMDLVPDVEKQPTEDRLRQFADRVQLVHVEGEGRLYRVK